VWIPGIEGILANDVDKLAKEGTKGVASDQLLAFAVLWANKSSGLN